MARGQGTQTGRTRVGQFAVLLLLAGGVLALAHHASTAMSGVRRGAARFARPLMAAARRGVTAGARDLWRPVGPAVIAHTFVADPASPSQLPPSGPGLLSQKSVAPGSARMAAGGRRALC